MGEMEGGGSGGGPVTQDFKRVPVHVDRVIIDGLGRTKDNILANAVQPIFKTENFHDMITASHDVQLHLERLGVFKSISMYVDIARGKDSHADGYEVTFEVEEYRRVAGGINTMVGTNDASLLFSMRLPNALGHGECLHAEYSHGTKQSRSGTVNFIKPLQSNPDIVFTSGIYQNQAEYPWSGFKKTDRGISIDLSAFMRDRGESLHKFKLPSTLGSHCFKWEGVWRDLRALSPSTAFAVRQNAGHSLKSSVKHILISDRRDDSILPKSGSLLRLEQEFAGVGGNVRFIKHDALLQINKSLIWDTVLQLSMAGGIMKSLHPDNELRVNDRFFLGGPLTLRGFNLWGVGPSSNGNSLGADTYWTCAGHIYTPLPFRPGKGGFGDLFKSHAFVCAGNLANINFTSNMQDNWHRLSNGLRLSCGIGIALRLGRVARLELNYVHPLRVQKEDSVNAGVQFGIGLSFL